MPDPAISIASSPDRDYTSAIAATLLDLARRYAERHADAGGVARTPIAGLSVIRATSPTELQFAVNRPLVAIVLQGAKRVAMGGRAFDFGAGESLLITTDVPTASQITKASAGAPYVSLVVELDRSLVEELVVEIGPAPFPAGGPVRIDLTEADVADTALRLLRLLDRPSALTVLQAQLLRELHFWLLSGRHGGAIRNLGVVDSHAHRIGRAVAVIRTDYAKPLRVERLAAIAGLSLSTFHDRFRAITSLTPLQLQKQLRLIEARRMMLSDGSAISVAAHTVGYESVPQFTREYGRMFGLPPAKDIKSIKRRLPAAA